MTYSNVEAKNSKSGATSEAVKDLNDKISGFDWRIKDKLRIEEVPKWGAVLDGRFV